MTFLLLQAAAIKKTQEILAVKETLKKKQEEKRKVCNENGTFRVTCWIFHSHIHSTLNYPG
jgi:hypothetical protein